MILSPNADRKRDMNMKNSTTNFVLAGLVLSLAAGCGSKQLTEEQKHYKHGESYLADGVAHDEEKFIEITIANGARADGTLRPVHFTGTELNSLGKKKLNYMLDADTGSATTLTVYIDIPKSDEAFEQRHESVTGYLKTQGLKDAQIALVDGPNVKYTAPAAQGTKALDAFSGSDGSYSGAAAGSSAPAGK
jgi:hypothetical protein